MKNFEQFLNEKVDTYDFGFVTILKRSDVDLTGFEGETIETYIEANDVKIEWEMDFDNRKFGINSMAPIINNVTSTFNVVTPGDDEDEEKEMEFVLDKDWETSSEIDDFKFGHGFNPQSIEIDFKNKKITVKF